MQPAPTDSTTSDPVPLVTDALAERLRASASRVGEALAADMDRATAGLSGGHMGVAVMLAQLGRLLDRSGWIDLARDAWGLAMDALADRRLPMGLYSGVAGIAWGSAHLEREFFGQEGLDFSEIDDALSQWLRSEGPMDYDLIAGWVGAGVYALERWPDPHAGRLLEEVVRRLQRDAVRSEDEATWKTDVRLVPPHQRPQAPDGYYNLGLAHGVPGVVALLAQVERVGALDASGRELLESSVRWLSRQCAERGSGLRYASWQTDPPSPATSRLGWCYGDLGVGAALSVAGACAGRRDWLDEGIQLAVDAARLDPERHLVRDQGLCHGSAGVAHVLHRLYRLCGKSELAELAREWLQRTLDMRTDDIGIDGYAAWRALNSDTAAEADWQYGFVPDSGYLTGAGGVALALASATVARFADWDRPLLLSFPEGRVA